MNIKKHTIKNNKPIVLLGFMGCGKTTVGKIMAELMSRNFWDLDQLIEKQVNLTIANYFKEHSEAEFRQLEKEILHKTLLSGGSIILALGGGTPCFFDNMDFIKKHAISIYLQATPQLIVSRIQKKKFRRPLIKNISDKSLQSFVRSLLKKRRKFYKQADIKVRVNASSDVLAQRITEKRLIGYVTS